MEEEQRRRVGRTAAELTFWTLCPYCYCAHEYEKAYEECCLRCANCGRGFHAAAIRAPPEATASGGGGVVHNGVGGGHYNCRLGLFPLRYEEVEEKIDVGDHLVEISSDEEEEGGRGSVADDAGRGNAGSDGEEGTKKMEEEEEEEEGSGGGELEFEYVGDDILVSAA
ncbi:hypothetical protein EUGRSUZ_H04724 [Eucalyptus grandis]|uniref:Uncharacterized protein n=2 Tax=Eucalyptus grandis TaxID=71139 RepID=A0ACC3JXN1_EUCGR|nr:hypothetical protein EUGRSUZ_H04724 [Eucalyptus grandis]